MARAGLKPRTFSLTQAERRSSTNSAIISLMKCSSKMEISRISYIRKASPLFAQNILCQCKTPNAGDIQKKFSSWSTICCICIKFCSVKMFLFILISFLETRTPYTVYLSFPPQQSQKERNQHNKILLTNVLMGPNSATIPSPLMILTVLLSLHIRRTLIWATLSQMSCGHPNSLVDKDQKKNSGAIQELGQLEIYLAIFRVT